MHLNIYYYERFWYINELLSDKHLAQIGNWIDRYLTIPEFILPEKSELRSNNLMSKHQHWFSIHMRTSQYFTQIVKCLDVPCCRAREVLISLLRFLPLPIPINHAIKRRRVKSAWIKIRETLIPISFCLSRIKWDELLPRSTRLQTVTVWTLLPARAEIFDGAHLQSV